MLFLNKILRNKQRRKIMMNTMLVPLLMVSTIFLLNLPSNFVSAFTLSSTPFSMKVKTNTNVVSSRISTNLSMTGNVFEKGDKGKILVLGGSGFLGGTIARRAILEGYSVTSVSRRGKPDEDANEGIDYRVGDARTEGTIEKILKEGDYKAVVHCIGLLFDGESGIGNLNKFVSGSGSVPDEASSYDDITRKTAFNAIEAAEDYSRKQGGEPLPFIFTSAAEAGWPDVKGGSFVEANLAPGWLRRYLVAKRAVESRLMDDQTLLRPVIFRPSLIYSLDRIPSLPPVGAFFVGNKIGLPFVDRPVTVQALSAAAIKSLSSSDVRGVQRFMQIDELSK